MVDTGLGNMFIVIEKVILLLLFVMNCAGNSGKSRN
jgi:hypothetical protein